MDAILSATHSATFEKIFEGLVFYFEDASVEQIHQLASLVFLYHRTGCGYDEIYAFYATLYREKMSQKYKIFLLLLDLSEEEVEKIISSILLYGINEEDFPMQALVTIKKGLELASDYPEPLSDAFSDLMGFSDYFDEIIIELRILKMKKEISGLSDEHFGRLLRREGYAESIIKEIETLEQKGVNEKGESIINAIGWKNIARFAILKKEKVCNEFYFSRKQEKMFYHLLGKLLGFFNSRIPELAQHLRRQLAVLDEEFIEIHLKPPDFFLLAQLKINEETVGISAGEKSQLLLLRGRYEWLLDFRNRLQGERVAALESGQFVQLQLENIRKVREK